MRNNKKLKRRHVKQGKNIKKSIGRERERTKSRKSKKKRKHREE